MSTDYYRQSRTDVAALVSMHAPRALLDVGCGEGLFASSLKHKFDCEAWGIEPHHASAAVAKKELDHVIESDWVGAAASIPESYFDLVFFNDVLEHMVDPYECLRVIRTKLSDRGLVYASIPNVIFISICRVLKFLVFLRRPAP